MSQPRRSIRRVALLLGFSLLVAACSSSSGDDDSESQSESESDEQLDPQQVLAADAEVGESDPSCEGASDGVLQIGSLLPATGELAALGPPMFAAAQLAVTEINDAGGVNGQPVDYRIGDEGGANAGPTVDGHLDAGIDMILGAASTAVSEEHFDRIIDACTIMFSPANTGANFTVAEDDGMYFRTAPTDVLQGRVLAQLAQEDSVGTAAILARDDGYGESLAFLVREPLEANGVDVVAEQLYDPDSPDIQAGVDAVLAADPGALFVIGYDESSAFVQALWDEGFTPATKKIYLADGNTSNSVGDDFTEPGALAGVRGTYPSAEVAAAFTDRLKAVDATLVDVVYGPETYDAVIITALAAVAAGTDQPDAVAHRINGITRDGTPCTAFAECRDLLAAGTDVDYNGPSGLLDFARSGEPTTATIAVLTFGADNRIDTAATQYRDVTINGLT
jgi:ABC-type branched-subunit amino acid transport system substrate-binding protein